MPIVTRVIVKRGEARATGAGAWEQCLPWAFILWKIPALTGKKTEILAEEEGFVYKDVS